MTSGIIRKISSREWAGVVPSFAQGGRFVATITCSACGAVKRWTSPNMWEPSAAAKKTRKMGWSTGGRPLCPECLKPKSKENKPMNNVTPLKASDPTGTDVSDAVRLAKRMARRTLEDDAYDEANKRYKDGWDDARIAKDVGLAAGVIAGLRVDMFGQFGEPKEIGDIRAALGTLAGDLAKLQARFDAACAKLGFKP